MDVAELVELLEARAAETLRLTFIDGEVYELTAFSLHMDDSEVPRASALVARRVAAGAKSARNFAAGKAMMFSLQEVKLVGLSESTGGRLWSAT